MPKRRSHFRRVGWTVLSLSVLAVLCWWCGRKHLWKDTLKGPLNVEIVDAAFPNGLTKVGNARATSGTGPKIQPDPNRLAVTRPEGDVEEVGLGQPPNERPVKCKDQHASTLYSEGLRKVRSSWYREASREEFQSGLRDLRSAAEREQDCVAVLLALLESCGRISAQSAMGHDWKVTPCSVDRDAAALLKVVGKDKEALEAVGSFARDSSIRIEAAQRVRAMQSGFDYRVDFDLATQFLRRGDIEKAMPHLRQAAQYGPRDDIADVPIEAELVNGLISSGRLREAAEVVGARFAGENERGASRRMMCKRFWGEAHGVLQYEAALRDLIKYVERYCKGWTRFVGEIDDAGSESGSESGRIETLESILRENPHADWAASALVSRYLGAKRFDDAVNVAKMFFVHERSPRSFCVLYYVMKPARHDLRRVDPDLWAAVQATESEIECRGERPESYLVDLPSGWFERAISQVRAGK